MLLSSTQRFKASIKFEHWTHQGSINLLVFYLPELFFPILQKIRTCNSTLFFASFSYKIFFYLNQQLLPKGVKTFRLLFKAFWILENWSRMLLLSVYSEGFTMNVLLSDWLVAAIVVNDVELRGTHFITLQS